MQDIIIDQVNKTMSKAFRTIAKSKQMVKEFGRIVEPSQVSLLLYLDKESDNELRYLVNVDETAIFHITIDDIITTLVDWKNMKSLVPKFIGSFLSKTQEQLKTPNVEVFFHLSKTDDTEVDLFLYIDGKFKKKLSYDDIVTPEIMMEQMKEASEQIS